MSRDSILKKLTEVFCDVFDDANIVLDERITSQDINNWDSLMHILLITEIEAAFNIKFSAYDITGMKNIGEIMDAIAKEL